MIKEALTYISGKINSGFFSTSDSPRVILGNITTLSEPGPPEPNVLLSLINIEEEVLLRNPENINRSSSVIYKNSPIHLNITIIFGAYRSKDNDSPENYEGSIANIQKVIGFFQRQNIFEKDDKMAYFSWWHKI